MTVFSRLITLCVLASAPVPALADVRLEVKDGNLYAGDGEASKQLTTSGRDGEAVLSPDKKLIVFTRKGKRAKTPGAATDDDDCDVAGEPDELRLVRLDKGGDELLVKGRRGAKPQENLCGFSRKQFTSDGGRLYFLTSAWTTSSALHVYDFKSRKESFVLPANDVVVLNGCEKPEYRDNLAVQQHRYFVVAGSYDWYWLYDKDGKKQKGPIGEQESAAAVLDAIESVGLCKK